MISPRDHVLQWPNIMLALGMDGNNKLRLHGITIVCLHGDRIASTSPMAPLT